VSSRRTVSVNGLESRIKVIKTNEGDALISMTKIGVER
jgi:hypothetical protein